MSREEKKQEILKNLLRQHQRQRVLEEKVDQEHNEINNKK
jgi:hypothetical protein